MSAVWMFIEKFGERVKIDEDHPLAVAQRAKDAAAPKVLETVITSVAEAPVVNEQKEIIPVDPPAEKLTRKRGRDK